MRGTISTSMLITIAITIAITFAIATGCGDDGPIHPEGIGNACVSDDDCPTHNCYLGPAGGYCTSDCQNEGSTSECPVDTVCKPIQGGARRCLLVCGTEHYCPVGTSCDPTWCPLGSSCVSVSNTTLQACEPEPG